MATNIPPERPYDPVLDRDPLITETDRDPLSPHYETREYSRYDGSGIWLPLILGALVVLGLLYWLAGPHRGFMTASNDHTSTTSVQPDNTGVKPPPATQPPATQPPASQPTNP
jgi:hypothetical protein